MSASNTQPLKVNWLSNKQSMWNALGNPTKPITADSSMHNAGQSAIGKQIALEWSTKPITADASNYNWIAAYPQNLRIVLSQPSWHTTITATEVVNRVVNSVVILFGYEQYSHPQPARIIVAFDHQLAFLWTDDCYLGMIMLFCS